MSELNLAPVVLFVYNRLEHTKKTINSLLNNKLALYTDLYIYSDGPKNNKDEKKILDLRNYISTIDGFASVSIIHSLKNKGLAQSIIEGVSNIIEKYGKVIVLEDDMITSPYFLNFMNNALVFYEFEDKVWHISGWNYPINLPVEDDAFFWKVMNCWGWATWADRWKYFTKNPEFLINEWSDDKKKEFDLDGSGIFWNQVVANYNQEINTWAIFWYASIFVNNGLCLNPTQSYVYNIGLDGTGTNCGKEYSNGNDLLCEINSPRLPINTVENSVAVEEIKKFFRKQKKNFLLRMIKKITRILFR
ncbi:sugar transferase [Celerinatantimonas sp. YJH-8]|uniref:sugar transferase n=1 Tax=Celerinatantimonas sp. YJH-8 TaxID=3228714 RepID=UPI0038C01CE1